MKDFYSTNSGLMLLIVWFCANSTALAADKAKLYTQLERHEGKRNKVYKDSEGIPTIGIGFNLQRPDAKQKIEGLGLTYDKVVAGEQTLSDAQIKTLFESDVDTAIGDAKQLVPKFDQLDDVRQRVLVDMAFNLGRARLGKFKKMLAAVNASKFGTAADEMVDSKWYRQVKSRGKTLVGMMRSGKDPAWLK